MLSICLCFIKNHIISIDENYNFIHFFLFLTECQPGMFLYDGQCYTDCPDRTYIVPEKTVNRFRKLLKSRKSSASLRDVSHVIRAVSHSMVQKQCAPCHTSCLKCRGPNEYECTQCTLDTDYIEKTASETYCFQRNTKTWVSSEIIYLNNNNESESKGSPMISFERLMLYSLGIIILLVTIILLITNFLLKQCFNGTNSGSKLQNKYAYDRIAYDGSNEQHIIEQEILNSFSDSENEHEQVTR